MQTETQEKKYKLVVAGGGTGGHVLAGVAVADAWTKRFGEKSEIIFVGARGGLEERLVPRHGYPLRLLGIGALNRVSSSRRLKTLFQLPVALARSAIWLWLLKPDAVLGVGGYASGPLVLMARFFTRAQTAILEQNSVPGFTNRVLGRFVHLVFCAFPGMQKHFPERTAGRDLIETGNPVRSALGSMPPVGGPLSRVFVFGGSQGAMGVNTAALEAARALKQAGVLMTWVHQTGEKDFERVRDQYAEMGVNAEVQKFIYDMASQYQQAGLVVCRAGSSTLSEIASVGRAAVLIPFPQASDNHQVENAKIFVERGAAQMIEQGPQAGTQLAAWIQKALSTPDILEQMQKKVSELARPKAAQEIVQLLVQGQFERPIEETR